jgi:hypothetical protein
MVIEGSRQYLDILSATSGLMVQSKMDIKVCIITAVSERNAILIELALLAWLQMCIPIQRMILWKILCWQSTWHILVSISQF